MGLTFILRKGYFISASITDKYPISKDQYSCVIFENFGVIITKDLKVSIQMVVIAEAEFRSSTSKLSKLIFSSSQSTTTGSVLAEKI